MKQLARAMRQAKAQIPMSARICSFCHLKGHTATKCELSPMRTLPCQFRRKNGHNEQACYEKQFYDEDQAELKAGKAP